MTLQVVLGTVRNASIDWRAETSDIVSAIGQRSHAVLSDLLTSLDHLALVRAGDRGPYDRHIDIALNFAGNAVQKFDDLELAICATDEQAKSSFKGLDPLAKQLGETIELFPDKNTHWQAERAKTSNYRNYLTHQGRIFRIHHNGDILIPSPESLKNRRVYTWTHADRAYAAALIRISVLLRLGQQ